MPSMDDWESKVEAKTVPLFKEARLCHAQDNWDGKTKIAQILPDLRLSTNVKLIRNCIIIIDYHYFHGIPAESIKISQNNNNYCDKLKT